jgi:alkyl hydroperoxide reductase subunit AhpC
MQACSFRDSYEQFKKAGAEVVGVSGDTPESHKVLDATPHRHLSIHVHQIYVHILVSLVRRTSVELELT